MTARWARSHANSPREALSRLELMITMGGYTLPTKTIREMIAASVDVIIQAARLRDGSRRITHITEVMGMEGDVVITQDLFVYEIVGEDAQGKLNGRHRSTGIGRPRLLGRARYYGEEKRLPPRSMSPKPRMGRKRSSAGKGISMSIRRCRGDVWRSRSGGLAFALVGGDSRARQTSRRRRQKRRQDAQCVRERRSGSAQKADRRRSRDIEKRESGGVSLADPDRAGGLTITTADTYWIRSLLRGLCVGAVAYLEFGSALLALLVGVIGAIGLPQLALARLRKRRINKFIANFPTAIDIIVRGIKSGLPLGDTIRIAAAESPSR